MTTIVRFDPFKGMSSLHGCMTRMLDESARRTRQHEEEYVSGSWIPNVDVRETKESLVLQAELPGVDPKEVQVSVENSVLSLKGARNFEKATEGEAYHRVERTYGAFERSFTLPTNVDPDRIEAAYKYGILTLTLPKREEAKPKSINITVTEK